MASGGGIKVKLYTSNVLTFICNLIQEESTGDITFYMKGADVAMASIVQYNDWLEEEVRARELVALLVYLVVTNWILCLC